MSDSQKTRTAGASHEQGTARGALSFLVHTFIERPSLSASVLAATLIAGLLTAPFSAFDTSYIPRFPAHVDALPDSAENQQIIFVSWPGATAEDIDEQVTYPLTAELLGAAGVTTIRAQSAYSRANLNVVFEDNVPFETARLHLTETLASLRSDLLPDGATVRLGPGATPLGQVLWYVLRVVDDEGNAVPGAFDEHELRLIQDFVVRPALTASPGVAEVASIGGAVPEWRVEFDPEQLHTLGLSAQHLESVLRESQLEVFGGQSDEAGIRYLVQGRGRSNSLEELSRLEIGRGLLLAEAALIRHAPAPREGLLDVRGEVARSAGLAEGPSVGGVVVARQGQNPREVVDGVKARIDGLSLASREVMLPGGHRGNAHVEILVVYDRSTLIDETLVTLESTLSSQLLLAALVLLVFMRLVFASALVALLPPLAMLVSFALMRAFEVTANVMSLAGLAIAIGSMIDISIVIVDAAMRGKLDKKNAHHDNVETSVARVMPAVSTSALTTVVAFVPLFALTGQSGRLFAPLVFAKSFGVLAALVLGVTLIAPAAVWLRRRSLKAGSAKTKTGARLGELLTRGVLLIALFALVAVSLSIATVAICAAVVIAFVLFSRIFKSTLRATLRRPKLFLFFALLIATTSLVISFRAPFSGKTHFDEGAFLLMPIVAPQLGVGAVAETLTSIDAAIAAIPEVELVVGKAGRVESPLDPAPMNMLEVMIFYKPEHGSVEGERTRLWREHIHSPADIWEEVLSASTRLGLSSAPPLQPIETRQVMLESGIRGKMAVRLVGEGHALREAGTPISEMLSRIDSIQTGSVQREQSLTIPAIDITPKNDALQLYGVSRQTVLQAIATFRSGTHIGYAIDGRTRQTIRLIGRRDLRNNLATLESLPIPLPGHGDEHHVSSIPLGALVTIELTQVPQSVRSENGFETQYILMSPAPGANPSEVAREVESGLRELRESGALVGVRTSVAGTFRDEETTRRSLTLLLPISIASIFFLVLFQFRNWRDATLVLLSASVALAGGALSVVVFSGGFSHASFVGLIALVGIAIDDAVLMMGFLKRRNMRNTRHAARLEILGDDESLITAASARLPALVMTTASTVLALVPILIASGRGSELMGPLAIPLAGGMIFELASLFILPALVKVFRR